jgi:hypothetical protein
MLFHAMMEVCLDLLRSKFWLIGEWSITYTWPRLFDLYNICDITFLTMFILTHPVNFPCERKPEHPEKTHDFRQSVNRLFSHESVARIQPTNSEVKGACSDDHATETSRFPLKISIFHFLSRCTFMVVRSEAVVQESKDIVAPILSRLVTSFW